MVLHLLRQGDGNTLYDYGVTELCSLIAVNAATRLGLRPTYMPLDPTSFHLARRNNSDEKPDEQVMHITKGYVPIIAQRGSWPPRARPAKPSTSIRHGFGQRKVKGKTRRRLMTALTIA